MTTIKLKLKVKSRSGFDVNVAQKVSDISDKFLCETFIIHAGQKISCKNLVKVLLLDIKSEIVIDIDVVGDAAIECSENITNIEELQICK